MPRAPALLLTLSLAGALVTAPSALGADLILEVPTGAGAARAAAAAAGLGQVVEVDARLGAVRLRTPMPGVVGPASAALPGVSRADLDRRRRLLDEPFVAGATLFGRTRTWAQEAVGAAAARDLVDRPGRIAVVDSGVDEAHPDLAGLVVARRDFTGEGRTDDLLGHGTFVAGLAAGAANGVGTYGVAAGASIVSARVVSERGTISDLDAAQAIVWSADQGARVINLSFGGTSPDLPVLDEALRDVARRGVLVVAAAGNTPADGVVWPAQAVAGVGGRPGDGLAVGASTPSGVVAPWSPRGPALSLIAPGAGAGDCADGLVSAIPASAVAWDGDGDACVTLFEESGGRWATGQGTSYSTPLVAGAAALATAGRSVLSPRQLATAITRAARRPGEWTVDEGWGVLDAAAAVRSARTWDSLAPLGAASATPRADGLLVRAPSVADRRAPGEDPAPGPVVRRLAWSEDGIGFGPESTFPIAQEETLLAWPSTGRLWLRTTWCDGNENCSEQASGPFATPPGARAPAAAPLAAPGGSAPTASKAVAIRTLGLACRRLDPRTARVRLSVRNLGGRAQATLTLGALVRRSALLPAGRTLRVPVARPARTIRVVVRLPGGGTVRGACRVGAA